MRLLLLGLPFLFLTTAIAGQSFDFLVDSRSRAFELFVILFLTSPHGIFTIPLIGLPEIRAMIQERTGGQPAKFWLPVAGIFALGLVMYTLAQESMPAGQGVTVLAQLAIELIAYEHGIKQILGLCLIYNSRLRREGNVDQKTLADLVRSEKRERLLLAVFGPTYLLFRTFDLMRFLEPGSRWSEIVSTAFLVPKTATILLGAAIFVNVLLMTRKTRDWEKLFYIGRISLFVGAASGLPDSFMNGSLLAAHATEYLGVYGTLQGNSKTPMTRKTLLFATGIMLSAVLIAFAWLNHKIVPDSMLGLSIAPWLPVLHAFAAIEGGIAFMHYYLDRQFFRARYGAVRDHVMPLFATIKKAA